MAGMVVGGLFNAVAFAGAGFLFSKLNHSGYEKEIHRHNEAMEKLQKDKDAWYEKTVEKRNKLMQLEDDIKKADKDLDTTNEYFTQFKKVSEELKEENEKKPKLSNYYKPSNEMQNYVNIFSGLMAVGAGGLVFYLV